MSEMNENILSETVSPELLPAAPSEYVEDVISETAETAALTESEAATEETPEKKDDIPDVLKRKPYHERYYLLYGNSDVPPEKVDAEGTLEFLKSLGFGDNSLRQAREKKNLSAFLENEAARFAGNRTCDFCGAPMYGTEFDVLRDGRHRCTSCSRSVVRKAEDFAAILSDVTENFERLFGVEAEFNLTVKTVNQKKLSRDAKRRLATRWMKDRIICAIKKNRKGYELYLENGVPRLYAICCMVWGLTAIWQVQNWNVQEIRKLYGPSMYGQVFSGMGLWAAVQYFYLIGEAGYARKLEMAYLSTPDEAGKGFEKYCKVYPLEEEGSTPFDDPKKPL